MLPPENASETGYHEAQFCGRYVFVCSKHRRALRVMKYLIIRRPGFRAFSRFFSFFGDFRWGFGIFAVLFWSVGFGGVVKLSGLSSSLGTDRVCS